MEFYSIQFSVTFRHSGPYRVVLYKNNTTIKINVLKYWKKVEYTKEHVRSLISKPNIISHRKRTI